MPEQAQGISNAEAAMRVAVTALGSPGTGEQIRRKALGLLEEALAEPRRPLVVEARERPLALKGEDGARYPVVGYLTRRPDGGLEAIAREQESATVAELRECVERLEADDA